MNTDGDDNLYCSHRGWNRFGTFDGSFQEIQYSIWRISSGLGEDAQLVVGGGHAGAVAEFLEDGQCPLVVGVGGVVVAPGLGEDAQLAVGVGHAGAVAEFLEDGQCLLVAGAGGVVVF